MKRIIPVLALLLSVLLTFGSVFLFHACEPMEDGSWMMCHYAQLVVTVFGAVIMAICILRIIIPASLNAARGLSLACIPVSAACIMIPQNIIPLCMMDTMRCHSVMRPAVIVIGIMIIVLSIIDLICNNK